MKNNSEERHKRLLAELERLLLATQQQLRQLRELLDLPEPGGAGASQISPLSLLDGVADGLLFAHSCAARAKETELTRAIEAALFSVGFKIAQRTPRLAVRELH
jgi:hypothetical protein